MCFGWDALFPFSLLTVSQTVIESWMDVIMICCQSLGPDHTDEGVCVPSQLLLATNRPWLKLPAFQTDLIFSAYRKLKAAGSQRFGSPQCNNFPPVRMHYIHTRASAKGGKKKNKKSCQRLIKWFKRFKTLQWLAEVCELLWLFHVLSIYNQKLPCLY